jgi:hypothetical protein
MFNPDEFYKWQNFEDSLLSLHVNFFDDQVGGFSSKREILEFAINKEGSSYIKNRFIFLSCENTPYFKKFFENMAVERGSLQLNVGEFTSHVCIIIIIFIIQLHY